MNSVVRSIVLFIFVGLLSQSVNAQGAVVDKVKKVCGKNAVGQVVCWLTETVAGGVVEHHVGNILEGQEENKIDPRKQAILYQIEDLKRRFDSLSPAQQAMYGEEMNNEYQRLHQQLRSIH